MIYTSNMKTVLLLTLYALSTLALAAFLASRSYQVNPEPTWNGSRYVCPVGYDVYASERELVSGQDFVHCVR